LRPERALRAKKRTMNLRRHICLVALVLGSAGLFACLDDRDRDCPGDGPCYQRPGAGGGTWIRPGDGYENPHDGGRGGEGGQGGEGGAGGAGGEEQYVDDQGICRTDASFDRLGCPQTYAEALLMDRCGSGLCQGVCGFQLFVQDFCTPSLRCVYGIEQMLVGVVLGSDVPEFCEESSRILVYGDACPESLEELGAECGF